jgi:FMN-dependent NADH-azoreductase
VFFDTTPSKQSVKSETLLIFINYRCFPDNPHRLVWHDRCLPHLHKERQKGRKGFMLLLNIQSSPRGTKSASIAVTNAFLDAYQALHSDAMIDTLNVWDENLPDFDSEAIGAKYKGVSHRPMDAAEAEIWERIQSLAKRFQRADRIVLGVPMWNFAIPYKLKQLIDLACQRNFLFTFANGVFGPLLKTPRALVVYTRGQTYSEDSPTPPTRFDHQTAYINFWLHFIGVQQVETVIVENTWSDNAEENIARGQNEARNHAASF